MVTISMCTVIRDSAEAKVKKVLNAAPRPLRYILCASYWRLIRIRYRMTVWYQYEKNHDAPINPFELLSISPDEINHYSKRVGNKRYPLVKSGGWDSERTPFEQGAVYQSFHDRFIEDRPWSETERYSSYLEKYGCEQAVLERSDKLSEAFDIFDEVSTMEDAFGKYDHIYRQIRDEGYKLQSEIHSISDRMEHPGHHSSVVPEFDEITVDIARDGTMLCYCGQHRLAIAKILELDSIPVRVRLRHEQWQRKRDAVWRGEHLPMKHPDIKTL